MDKKPNVLLVCSNDGFQNLLRIPLILHEAGCNVTLLTVQNNLLARSRFVNFVLPPESDIRSLIIALKTHLSGKQGHYAWVLIGDESPLFEISVIEFHARPPSGFHLGKVCNVNFADGIRDMLSGKKTLRRPVVPPSFRGPKRAYMFPQHISRCIKERDFKDLIHWIPGVKANCHYDILLGDPGLFKSIILQCTLNKFINLFIRSSKSIIFSLKEKT